MKILLKILSIFTLFNSNVLFNTKINQVSTLDNEVRFSVPTYHETTYGPVYGIKQDGPDYNLAANIQEILRAKKSKTPSQKGLKSQFFNKLYKKAPYSFKNSVTKLLNSYLYEKDHVYFNKTVKANFCSTDSEKMLFQTAIFYSLSKGFPVLLQVDNLRLPWWDNRPIKPVFITIYTVSTKDDDDPSKIIYTVVDPEILPNTVGFLYAQDLSQLFFNGAQLWMPDDLFDFENNLLTFNIDVTQSNFNKLTDFGNKTIRTYQSANIFKSGGIYSFEWIKKYTSRMTWNKSYLYYSWKGSVFKKPETKVYFDKDALDESNLTNIPKYNISFTDSEEHEKLTIDTSIEYRYQYLGARQRLDFFYTINWYFHKEFISEFPYIGVSMGNSWTFHWK